MEKRISLTNRILLLLEGAPGEPWSPWQIGKILNANRKSISSLITKIKRRENSPIRQYQVRGRPPMPGFYCWSPPQPTNPLNQQAPPFQIHNFQIWIERPLIDVNGRTLQIIGTDILETIRKKLPYADIEQKKTSTYCYYNLGPNRNLTVQVAPKGSITIWTECSNNPINASDFSLYVRFLEMLFSEFWLTSNPRIKQLDFNKDYKGINVNGFSNITVQDVERELVQIYNKGMDLRTEKRYFTDLKPSILADEISKIGTAGNELISNTKLQELHDKINVLAETNEELKKGFKDTVQAVNTLVTVYSNPSFLRADVKEGYG